MKNRYGITLTICACLFALVTFSCESPIGLGRILHLEPPEITITRPDFMDNISGTLVIEGTAYDVQEVASIFVDIERINTDGIEWKSEFRSERGLWQNRSNVNPSWINTADANWSGTVNSVEWFVKVEMENAPEGEYLITARVVNSVQNSGAPSVQQRRVIIDWSPPEVSILAPEYEHLAAEPGLGD